tara:strand:+ start:210 stop:1109 length:900 start_codon:yes stop_codon:yes gene_type:complete
MIKIIDTHQHLWDLERLKLPWLDNVPALKKGYLPYNYLKAAEGTGINQTIYMEVDAHSGHKQKEIEDMTMLCKSEDEIMQGMVISGNPGDSGFSEFLEINSANHYIKGVRQVLHTSEQPVKHCLSTEFMQGIRELGKRGLLFDICIRPAEIEDAVELCRQNPETIFMLDHCGNADPYVVNGQRSGDTSDQDSTFVHSRENWQEGIRELGRLENVYCKISGIISRAETGWNAETLAPTVNSCMDSFGEDRVVFGGDWPVCTLGASLSEWVAALRQIVNTRTEIQQKKLFHSNAERLYNIG